MENFFGELVELLIPLVQSEAERRALLREALDGAVLGDVDYSGSAYPFLVNLAGKLLDYGEIAPGKPALAALLETAGRRMSTGKRAQVLALCAALEDARQVDRLRRHVTALRRRDGRASVQAGNGGMAAGRDIAHSSVAGRDLIFNQLEAHEPLLGAVLRSMNERFDEAMRQFVGASQRWGYASEMLDMHSARIRQVETVTRKVASLVKGNGEPGLDERVREIDKQTQANAAAIHELSAAQARFWREMRLWLALAVAALVASPIVTLLFLRFLGVL